MNLEAQVAPVSLVPQLDISHHASEDLVPTPVDNAAPPALDIEAPVSGRDNRRPSYARNRVTGQTWHTRQILWKQWNATTAGKAYHRTPERVHFGHSSLSHL